MVNHVAMNNVLLGAMVIDSHRHNRESQWFYNQVKVASCYKPVPTVNHPVAMVLLFSFSYYQKLAIFIITNISRGNPGTN